MFIFHHNSLKAVSSEKNLGCVLFFICKCNGKYFLLINFSTIPAVVIPQCKDNSIIRCKNLRNIRKHQTKIRMKAAFFLTTLFILTHVFVSLHCQSGNWQLGPLARRWGEWCRTSSSKIVLWKFGFLLVISHVLCKWLDFSSLKMDIFLYFIQLLLTGMTQSCTI